MVPRCRCPSRSARHATRKYVAMPGGFSYVNDDGAGLYDVWVRKTGATEYEAIYLSHYGDPYVVEGYEIDIDDYDSDRIEVALSYFDSQATPRDKNKVVAAIVVQDGPLPVFQIPSDGSDLKDALLRAAGMFGSPRRGR